MERDHLESLVSEGLSKRQIAQRLGYSPSKIQYWLNKYDVETQRKRDLRALRKGEKIYRECSIHGLVQFRPTKNCVRFRCIRCNTDRVARHRKMKKQQIVNEFGGKCSRCGYDKYLGALEFHHVDPLTKDPMWNLNNWGKSLDKLRLLTEGCILLCANCHREVEAGL